MTPKSLWNPEGAWIPLFVDRLLTSERWNAMKDYQRGWFMTLLVKSVKSERPGYLRRTLNLWEIAGACSEQYWSSLIRQTDGKVEPKYAAVLACFKEREIDGEAWIYNERLLSTLEDQESKFYRGRDRPKVASPSISPSEFSEEERTTTPNLPPLQLAKGLLEKLQLPVRDGALLDVEAAIKCAMGRKKYAPADAHDYLFRCAQKARLNGVKITRFWFQDADGWEINGKQYDKTSKAKQRAASNLRALGVLPEEDAVLGSAGDREGFVAGGRPTLGVSRAKATGAD